MKLVVEGELDRNIVQAFFRAANIPLNRVQIIVASGSREAVSIAKNLAASPSIRSGEISLLVDLDSNDSFNAENILRKRFQIEDKRIVVYAAVPEIEAWLFADMEAAKRKVQKIGKGSERLSRIPMPEDIPYPKYLAHHLFKFNEKEELIEEEINLSVAMKRVPSLRRFIHGIAHSLGIQLRIDWEKEYVRSEARDIFSLLMTEVIPQDTIVHKTLDGSTVTAEEMKRHIQEGTETGLRYSTELLRVARDLLARKAKKGL